MKKLSVIAFLLLFSSSYTFGNVFVTWFADGGFYYDPDPDDFLLGPIGSGSSALAQLIWRPNNSGPQTLDGEGTGVDEANAFTDNYLTGDDVLLDSFILTEGSNVNAWASFTAGQVNDGGSNPSDGYIYARIFETDTVTVGTRYYVGEVVLAEDLDPNPPSGTPDLPQSYNLNRGIGPEGDDPINAAFSFEVVPEPGTLALLALGVATLGGAAAKKRKAAIVEA